MSTLINPNSLYYPFKRNLPFLKGKSRRMIVYIYSAYMHRWAYYCGITRANSNLTTRFVIACLPRSGSSLLGSLIRSHPKVHWDGEVFHVNFLFPSLLINGLANRGKWSCYGVKLFLHQIPPDMRVDDFVKFVNKMHIDGWKFIVLVRKNLLRHALSIERHRRGEKPYVLKGEHVVRHKIHVNPDELKKILNWLDHFDDFIQSVFSSIPHLPLLYEADLQDASKHQATADRVFEFIGINSHLVSTPHVRQSSDRLEEEIDNFEDVVNALKGTKWASYISR